MQNYVLREAVFLLMVERVFVLFYRAMMAGAVAVIESWWWSTKNRKVFRILKETVRSAVSI